jgi:hypothetical protein
MFDSEARHAHHYRLTLDPNADIDGHTRKEGFWLSHVACQRGHAYPHGHQALGAYADRLHLIAALIGIPGVNVHVRGDAKCTVTFPADEPAIVEQVAGALRPFRRWQAAMIG